MLVPIALINRLATFRANEEALFHIYMNTKSLFAVNRGL
jgi:hypothetical protein